MLQPVAPKSSHNYTNQSQTFAPRFSSFSPPFHLNSSPSRSVLCRKVSGNGRFFMTSLASFLSLTGVLKRDYAITTPIHTSKTFFPPPKPTEICQNCRSLPRPPATPIFCIHAQPGYILIQGAIPRELKRKNRK